MSTVKDIVGALMFSLAMKVANYSLEIMSEETQDEIANEFERFLIKQTVSLLSARAKLVSKICSQTLDNTRVVK